MSETVEEDADAVVWALREHLNPGSVQSSMDAVAWVDAFIPHAKHFRIKQGGEGMSDYIDTREGWREVDQETARESESQLAMRDGNLYRYWVREEPMPPLPTEPYTVIRVTVDREKHPGTEGVWWRRNDAGDWWQQMEGGVLVPGRELHERITGFEVLSEPRKVAAKAIRYRLLEAFGSNGWARSIVRTTVREFEVEES